MGYFLSILLIVNQSSNGNYSWKNGTLIKRDTERRATFIMVKFIKIMLKPPRF